MSSFQCFLCHNTVCSITNEYTRDKYREITGLNLGSDIHLCHICCHMVNKLWVFKAICLKRSLEYPMLLNEKGPVNLQKNMQYHNLCSNQTCQIELKQVNFTSQHISYHNNNESYNEFNYINNKYVEIDHGFNEFEMSKTSDGFKSEFIPDDHNEVDKPDYNAYITENNGFNSSTDNEYNGSTDNENNEQIVNDYTETITQMGKKKKKKHKKNEFERRPLTLEEQKLDLDMKRKEKKYMDAEFKCYSCALGFLFEDTYQTHMMRHEESNGEYKCEVCTLRFASQSVLRAHRAVHARGYGVRDIKTVKEQNTPCHLCGRVFKDANGLQQHLRRFHQTNASNRSYSCNVCGKLYNNPAAVRTHLIKHINRKFECEQCSSTFSSPYTLNQHKKRHDMTTQELHHCEICNLTYTSRKSLLAHKRNALVHQNTVFKCLICHRICPNQRALTSHITTVHSTSKDYACHLCRNQYTSRKSLVRHLSSHIKPQTQEIHVCHRCPSTFKSKSKLNRHLKGVCEKETFEDLFK